MGDKLIELAKKLKALADRGEGGEKYNAEKQLQKLMDKHGLTMEDVEGEKEDYQYFKIPKEYRSLFHQTVSTIIGNKYPIYQDKRKRSSIVLKVTAIQMMEIESKYDFYLKAYKKELDVFFAAFVRVNDLYPKDGRVIMPHELSEEEKAEQRRIQKLSAGMEKQQFVKQLDK